MGDVSLEPLPYVRPLRLGSRGTAVEAAKRGVYRFLDNDAKWKGFTEQAPISKRTFGPFFRRDLILAQHAMTVGKDGVLDEPTLRGLEQYFDQPARALWLRQFPAKPLLDLCYPYPAGDGGGVCQGLHPTAGLTGNWAIDFCDTPGAHVLAVEAGVIQKLSGHPPGDDTADAAGVFGLNTYIRTGHGYVYFVTHLGWQNPALTVGSRVACGQVIGKVGDQHFRPDHCHIGVTSPLGVEDAKKRITAVSQAARVKAQ